MIEFSADEQRRIQRSLRKRFRQLDPANVVDVAIGTAMRGHALDEGRQPAVCVYVQRKRVRLARDRRIPSEIEVAWYRDRRLNRCRLPTDVIEVSSVRPSGFFYQHGGRQFVLGAEIAWRRPRRTDREAGWLTVGHALSQYAVGRRSSVPLDSGLELIARSRSRSPFDAAIIRHEQANRGRPYRLERRTEPWPVASIADVAGFAGGGGVSHLPSGELDIRFQAFLPRFYVPHVGQLVNVLAAVGPIAAFAPGTSGAVWLAKGMPSAMQVAASTAGYQLGFAQAIASSLVWAEQALERVLVPSGPVGRVELVSI